LLTVEVIVPDVHVVDTLIGEARRDRDVLLLHVEDEGQEALDVGRGNVIAIRPLYQGLGSAPVGGGSHLALDVEDRN
jgi:hypothetical protein